MCCLGFEQNAYEHLWKDTPTKGSLVKLPNGANGTVFDVNVLTGIVKVINSETDAIATFHKKDLKILKKINISEEVSPEVQELEKNDD